MRADGGRGGECDYLQTQGRCVMQVIANPVHRQLSLTRHDEEETRERGGGKAVVVHAKEEDPGGWGRGGGVGELPVRSSQPERRSQAYNLHQHQHHQHQHEQFVFISRAHNKRSPKQRREGYPGCVWCEYVPAASPYPMALVCWYEE